MKPYWGPVAVVAGVVAFVALLMLVFETGSSKVGVWALIVALALLLFPLWIPTTRSRDAATDVAPWDEAEPYDDGGTGPGPGVRIVAAFLVAAFVLVAVAGLATYLDPSAQRIALSMVGLAAIAMLAAAVMRRR